MKRIFALIIALLAAAALHAQTAEENHLWAPDSTWCAYNLGGDLYLKNKAGDVRRLTTNGSETMLNGYSSWVYFEEIFGRPQHSLDVLAIFN